eukprot:CAMPEP_0181453366 /NCGR_PEP_ID=MMETSP1110-20121109/29688_1 /TAXON_ID=174948 /ORGANISM="Symbiodinium sp., Strain CCMP421" /LENGTH=229 /DNA_ID=CAMNT_0023577683 /DNA_START=101 /DNA_END=790 /DNA_ORIENTATION=-
MRPQAASSLESALKQLRSCVEGKLPSAIFLVLLGSEATGSCFDEELISEVRQALHQIRKPVVGVVTASLCQLATDLLQSCDYVMTSDDAEFAVEAGNISAGEASARGLVQRVLQVADIGPEMAILGRKLQAMTHAQLASVKVDWLCAKASQLLSPTPDSQTCAGTVNPAPAPPVAKRSFRSFRACTILELDEDEEEQDEISTQTSSPLSSATVTTERSMSPERCSSPGQ